MFFYLLYKATHLFSNKMVACLIESHVSTLHTYYNTIEMFLFFSSFANFFFFWGGGWEGVASLKLFSVFFVTIL